MYLAFSPGTTIQPPAPKWCPKVFKFYRYLEISRINQCLYHALGHMFIWFLFLHLCNLSLASS
jgi:hypothetical protein